MKSYAAAVIAVILLFLVPAYGVLFRRIGKERLTALITCLFIIVTLVFYLLGQSGLDIGFAYYVWVGLFSVLITAQFWAFAADNFNVKSGQRLFPLIMIGATVGSMLAPALSGWLYTHVGPWWLMLLSMGLLGLTLFLIKPARRAIPPGSGPVEHHHAEPARSGFWGGIGLVMGDRYLLLLATLMVLLNWVNTTGEYILADLVVTHAEQLVAAGKAASKAEVIAAFYGSFFSIVNTLTVLLQVFVVARVIKWFGVRYAVMILPVIAVIGYGLIVFIPVFSIIRLVKMAENATDYSIMNTTRHALYLPLGPAGKYEGKTAIDAFFWRCGDLAQAGAIFVGLHWFGFELVHFALFNMLLALLWLFVAWRVGQRYTGMAQQVSNNLPPRLEHSIEPQLAPAGQAFEFRLERDTFIDPDAGDVIRYSASLAQTDSWPAWLHFSKESLTFRGIVPADLQGNTLITIRATDFDGAWAEGQLQLTHDHD